MKVRMIEIVSYESQLITTWGEGCGSGGCHRAISVYAKGDPGQPSEELPWAPWDDPAIWPKACEYCGAAVPEGKGPTSGSKQPIWSSGQGRPQPGDMWWEPGHFKHPFHWDNETDPRGHLMVICPNGIQWDIDSRARNCTMKEDRTHRCWVRQGEPPNITVGKGGFTCSAGAGSIQAGDYHGFLRNGEFVSC